MTRSKKAARLRVFFDMKTIFLLVSCGGMLLGMVAPALAEPSVMRPLINGDFEASPVGKPPIGWTSAYPGGTGTVFSDGKDTVLRLTSAQAANAGMAQVVNVP